MSVPSIDEVTSLVQGAMKSGDRVRVSALRMMLAALKTAEGAKAGLLGEDEALAVIAREAKRRDEAAAEFDRGGRPERAVTEREEAAILREFLPAPLSGEELAVMVDAAVAEAEASGPGDMGKVMKVLMPKVTGRADGAEVSRIVRTRLG